MEFLAVMKRISTQPAQFCRPETAHNLPGFSQPYTNMPHLSSPAAARNPVNIPPQMFKYQTNFGQQSSTPSESPCSSAEQTSPQSDFYEL